jgi:hypothetical protein
VTMSGTQPIVPFQVTAGEVRGGEAPRCLRCKFGFDNDLSMRYVTQINLPITKRVNNWIFSLSFPTVGVLGYRVVMDQTCGALHDKFGDGHE